MADTVETKLDRILDVVSRMEVRMDHHHERLEKQCATIGEHDARLKASEAQGAKVETLLKGMQEATVDQKTRVKVLEADGNRRDGQLSMLTWLFTGIGGLGGIAAVVAVIVMLLK